MFAKLKTKIKAAAGKGDGLEPESEEFQTLVQGFKQTNLSFTRLNKVAKSLYEPGNANKCEQFITDEIKPVLKLEKAFQNLRIDLSVKTDAAAKAEKKGGPKLQAAQEKQEESKRTYEQGREQLEQAIQALDAKKDAAYQDVVADLCKVLRSLTPVWGEPLPDFKAPAPAPSASAGPAAVAAGSSAVGHTPALIEDHAAVEHDQAESASGDDEDAEDHAVESTGQGFDAGLLAGGADNDAAAAEVWQQAESQDQAEQEQFAQPEQQSGGMVTLTASHGHVASGDDELSMEPGDTIQVLDDSTEGWWTGRNLRTGDEGLFPSNYCTPASAQE